MYAVKIENLSKSKGGFLVLDNISLCIPQGSAVCLEGDDFEAKKQLFQILIGLNYFNTGNITILEHDLKKHSQFINANIGYMPAYVFFSKRKTVSSILKFAAEHKHTDISQAKELCCLFEIGMNDFVSDLDDSRIRLVSFISAVVDTPKILILDEPMRALSIKQREILLTLLKRYYSSGSTILISCRDSSPFSELNPHRYSITGAILSRIFEKDELAADSDQILTHYDEQNKSTQPDNDAHEDKYSSCETESFDNSSEQNISVETIESSHENISSGPSDAKSNISDETSGLILDNLTVEFASDELVCLDTANKIIAVEPSDAEPYVCAEPDAPENIPQEICSPVADELETSAKDEHEEILQVTNGSDQAPIDTDSTQNTVNGDTSPTSCDVMMQESSIQNFSIPPHTGSKFVQLSCTFISPNLFNKINATHIRWYDNGVSFNYSGDMNKLILALLYCNITDIYICDIDEK